MVFPIMLVGTRAGDIFEASFSAEYAGIQKISAGKDLVAKLDSKGGEANASTNWQTAKKA
jgi:hypothetical protein